MYSDSYVAAIELNSYKQGPAA